MPESPTRPRAGLDGTRPAPSRTAPGRCGTGNFRDLTVRLIGVPLFGLIIPRVSGLLGDLTWHDRAYWGGTVWFVGISLAVWQGNRALLFWHRARLDWVQRPGWKLAALIGANLLYTTPVSFAMLVAWYLAAPFPRIDWSAVGFATFIIVVAVAFITHAYETVFLIRDRQGDRLQVAVTERARWQAEMETLKGQLAPHFLFNCLNTLAVLIEEEPESARRFNLRLASVCRYLLEHKERDLVPLDEELAFLDAYTDLARMRHLDGIQVIHRGLDNREGLFIPPASLQLLLENAIKHNECSPADPLAVELSLEGDALVVSNPIRPPPAGCETVGIGLQNLRERFALIAKRAVGISSDGRVFRVMLPLVRAPAHADYL
jgi:hypothetical protein